MFIQYNTQLKKRFSMRENNLIWLWVISVSQIRKSNECSIYWEKFFCQRVTSVLTECIFDWISLEFEGWKIGSAALLLTNLTQSKAL